MRTLLFFCVATCAAAQTAAVQYDYQLLATTKTSTMEKELNEAADAGFVFSSVMGGETAFGGKEVLVVMSKKTEPEERRHYKLLATSKTSTLEKELNEAGDEGFDYCGQTVFESAFGGREVSVIMERSSGTSGKKIRYKTLATSKTSTMQKELQEAGEDGFAFLGMMVGKTALGGNQVISILRKYAN